MTDLEAIKKLCEQLEHREVASLRLMREAAATLKPIAEGRSVVVPVEPTEAMVAAFKNGMKREFGMTTTDGYHGRIYHAMIQAAAKEKDNG